HSDIPGIPGKVEHGRRSPRWFSPTWSMAHRPRSLGVNGPSTTYGGRTEGVRRAPAEGACGGVDAEALLEADVTGGSHPTQQRKGQGNDAEGDGQADTHQGVVDRPELRDGGAGRCEPDEREDGRPVCD